MQITPLIINDQKKAKEVILSLGATGEGAKILTPKAVFRSFKIEAIRSWEANILKQHLLSLGSDAAVERDALIKDIETGVLLFGSVSQLRRLCAKLKNQTKRLKLISKQLRESLDNIEKESYRYRARDKVLNIKEPVVCGVVNVTRDSFSGDGLLKEANLSLSKLERIVLEKVGGMVKAGAKIIDIGAESTRPFSKKISPSQELKRIVPVIKALRKRFKKILISVDTYKFQVAKAALEEGVDIINDITALRSPKITSLVKKHKLGCVLMHMQASPQNMQVNPQYACVVQEIGSFFRERLEYCRKKGILSEQIFIDPGIGFGKLKRHNREIINNLNQFKVFGVPIFIGISRKSFIGDIIKKEPSERQTGTLAAEVLALSRGANVLRVHDVGQTKEAVKVFSEITKK